MVIAPQEQLAETLRIRDWARATPHASAPGWKDERLAKAYGLVSEVADSVSSESVAWPAVKAALDAIESADCNLEAGE